MIPKKLIDISVYAKNIINIDFSKNEPKSSNDLLKEQSTSKSSQFYTQRKAAQELVREYLENPYDLSILGRSQKIVEQLEVNDAKENCIDMRAKVNVSIMSGRMKRTHFSAYIAGKYSGDDKIPDVFKTWLHNSAANSAIDFMSCINDANSLLEDGMKKLFSEKEETQVTFSLLKMFEMGAREDAGRFLEMADSYDENAPLTIYNKARLAAYKNRIDRAMTYIDEISPPEKHQHPALLQWHLDNNFSYRSDLKLQQLFDQPNSHYHSKINQKLKLCAEQAQKYIKERGGNEGMWSEEGMSKKTRRQFHYSKALIAAVGVGVATLIIAQLDGETSRSALAFLELLFDNLDTIATADSEELQESFLSASASTGDGDWANTIHYDEGLLVATFGDGGDGGWA